MVTYLLDVSGAIDLGFLYTFSGIVMFVYCCVLCTGRYVNIFQSYFTELLQSDVYISTHPGPYFDNLLSNILLKLVPYHVGITICVWLARNSMFGGWHPTKDNLLSNILLKLVPYHVGITICVWLARNSMFGGWHPTKDNLLSNILLKLVPYHVGITICVWLARNSMFGGWHPTKSRTIVFLLWGGVSIDYIASGVLRHAVIRFWINSEIVIFTFEVLHDNNTIASFSFIYLLVPPSYYYC